MKSIVILPFISLIFVISGLFTPSITHSAELVLDKEVMVKGVVRSIISDEEKPLEGISIMSRVQVLDVELLSGDERGKRVEIINDYVPFKAGDTLYVRHTIRGDDGKEFYAVGEPSRLPTIFILLAVFIILSVVFGGWQGVRGLVSLAISLLLIFYALLPGIVAGFSPVLVSIVVSALIIVIGSYITHGFNKVTTSAVLGMIITVILTGIASYFAVDIAKLTGFEHEASVYLNLKTSGGIDLAGLLLGGIMIGLLGVLYDASIGQAVAVEELHKIGPHLNRRYIYRRAIRMGKEHIGALVDTLAIAYVGAGLPLLLLIYTMPDVSLFVLNREIFASEIIRTLIGSIGLILAVPITTLISVLLLIKVKNADESTSLAVEKKEIEEKEKSEVEKMVKESHGHIHSHDHDHGLV